MEHSVRRHHRLLLAVCVSAGFALTAGGLAFGLTSFGSSGTPDKRLTSLRMSYAERLQKLGQSTLAPAPTSKFTTLSASLDGRSWSYSIYENAGGDLCTLEVVPGQGRGYGCQAPRAIFAKGPLFADWGSTMSASDRTEWESAWVEGIAKSPIASVELVLANCTSVPLKLGPDGGFLGVVGPDAAHGGALPYEIRARDTSGTVVASTAVALGPLSSAQGKIDESVSQVAASTCP